MIPTQTIAAINATIIAQLEASFAQTIPIFPLAFNRVLAKVLAGVFILLYKYAGYGWLQLFVRYASFEETVINGRRFSPLVEWGRLVGVGDPNKATAAELRVTVVVSNQTGDLAAGSQLIRANTGFIYSVEWAVPLADSTVQATIQAVDDESDGQGLGALGNLQIGDTLAFANPLPNVNREVTVSAVLRTAADAEVPEAYRARVMRRFQRKPQGGAHADYQAWGEDVEGIANVYPYAGEPGIVDVYVEATEASSGSPDGIPTPEQLAAVASAMAYDPADGRPTRKHVTAGLNVMAITRQAVDVDITSLLVDDPVGTKADIEEAIDDHLRSLEPFIVGLSVLPRNDRALQSDLGGIVSDVVRAAGGTFGVVTMKIGGDVITAYTLAHGQRAKLGLRTYDGS